MSRSVCVTGGLGAIAQAAIRSCHARQPTSYGRFYLLYPPFDSNKVDEVMNSVDIGLRSSMRPLECDVTKEDAVDKAFAEMERDSKGTLSVLINSAGIAPIAPFQDYPLSMFKRNVDVNLIGAFLTSRAFARTLLNAEGERKGRMIHLASQAASIALDGHAGYSAAKAGLVAMSKNIASELSSKGITSVCVSPTVVNTPMGQKVFAGSKGPEFAAKVPLGRFAEEQEVGDLIAFLADENSEMINGIDILIDGGYTCR